MAVNLTRIPVLSLNGFSELGSNKAIGLQPIICQPPGPPKGDIQVQSRVMQMDPDCRDNLGTERRGINKASGRSPK